MRDEGNERLHIIEHPLVEHKLSILRDRSTQPWQFFGLVTELSLLLGFEALRDLPMEEVEVTTPLETCTCRQIAGKTPAIIPILRAGLGMVSGLHTLLPTAPVGHVGMQRDEQTHQPVQYYKKLPEAVGERVCLLVDPMLATGGSLVAAIEMLRGEGARDIRVLTIVASPEGIETVLAADPDVELYTCVRDRCLNEHAYILPGLGDAGDRIFGTM